MASFFKKLAKATPALTQGLVTGVKLRQDMDEAEARRRNAERTAGLQETALGIRNRELQAAAEKAQRDQFKTLAEEYTSGVQVIDGVPQVNPAFITPGTDLYKLSERQAALKRATPGLGAPRSTWKEIYAVTGKPIPAGIDPEGMVPDSVAARMLGAASGAGGAPVLTADQLAQLRAGKLTGNIPVPPSYINAIPRPETQARAPLGYRFTADGALEPIPGGPATRATGAPPGYRFLPDGSLEAIPGGPAVFKEEEGKAKAADTQRKAQAAEEKSVQAKSTKLRKAQTVVQDANRALAILEKQSPGVLGAIRQGVTSQIPGTEAADLERLLDTVKTIGGFEELQAMREASPTGGALGAVSDSENRMLQATIGNLEKSTSPATRAENLKRVINTYLDIIHGEGFGPPRYQLSFDEQGQPVTPSDRRANAARAPRPGPTKNEPVTGAAVQSGQKLGIDQNKLVGVRQFPTQGKVVKKQYNAAQNKTKLIYDNGQEVIVDGRQ